VRQSIPPVHQSKPDWAITSSLAQALGVDFDFQMSASAVFKELAESVPAYKGLRYPLLKDETKPVQAAYAAQEPRELSKELEGLRLGVEGMSETVAKIEGTPEIGHELFKIGTLTDKTPQFHLLAAGNPRPENVQISPLYQITIDSGLRRAEAEAVVAGD